MSDISQNAGVTDMSSGKNEVIDAISDANNILILGHVSPDGDCCGSACALALALSGSSKRIMAAFDAPLPKKYDYLGEYMDFYTADSLPKGNFDLVIAVDVADDERLGALKDIFYSVSKQACIDHHISNTGFAAISWVAKRSSAGEMVFELIDTMGVQMDKRIANALYTAINTDTGNFSYNNTDAACLGVASRLAAYGADITMLMAKIYGRRTLGATRIIGSALNTLKLYENGKIALIYITQEDLDRCGAKSEDCSTIVNYARDIEGVEVGIMLRQTPYGEYKLSLRSNNYADVGSVAAKFSGGGHKHAAGGKTTLPLDKAIESVLEETRKII